MTRKNGEERKWKGGRGTGGLCDAERGVERKQVVE